MNNKIASLAVSLLGCMATILSTEATAQADPPLEYELISLDALLPYSFARTTPAAINDNEQITGTAKIIFDQAFLYDAGVMTLLGTLGGSTSFGAAINELGGVVGVSRFTTANYDQHGFLHDGSQMIDIGTFEGLASANYESGAFGINNLGVITGWSEFRDPDNPFTGLGRKGFILDGGTWTAIPHVGIGSTHPYAHLCGEATAYGRAINDNGQVTGYGYSILDAATGVEPDCDSTHAFLYDGSDMIDLGTLGDPLLSSYGYDINEHGQVTGYSEIDGGHRLAFIADENGMSSIGTLGGSRSQGHGINDKGHVTGWAIDSEGQAAAFLYDGTEMVALCSLVDCEAYGWRSLRTGFAINNNGSIVGYGYVEGEIGLHGFLLRVQTDGQGPLVSDIDIAPPVSAVGGMFQLSATVDDSQTGGSAIESAAYTLDGENWHPMEGSWGSPTLIAHSLIVAPSMAGVHELCVRGTDARDNVGDPECPHFVAYDPGAGFLTGGGWFDSPPGACQLSVACNAATGKVIFGIVSNYKENATTPMGNTQFQFSAGGLNFHSTAYEWLVITGASASYQGTGTINGAGNYGFRFSAIDAGLTPDTDVDLVRVRIWDRNNGNSVVYDNQMTADEWADPTTAIGGGSIKIH